MIITPKQPRNDKTHSRLSRLVPYMLRGKGEERCTWYVAGNLPGLDRREDAELAVDVMELLQDGNQRAKGSKTYHLVISFHPMDRRLTPAELADVVARTLRAAGLEEHQYIAVRHSEQDHEHLHVAVNRIHPETLKIHHPYKAIHAYQVLARMLEEELGLHRVDRSRVREQSHRARDFEAHQSVESFARWARRTIGGAAELDRIGSWPALHEELGRFGVRLVPRGNGLAIVDATRPNLACKASSLGRRWSKQRLCERYGEFVPGPSPAEVAREQVHPYVERPIQSRDDDLWSEYQDALRAARTRRAEQREALARRVEGARAAQRQQFKLRHHAIAAMPIPPREKRKHYKALSFEKKVAERKLRTKIRDWRVISVGAHPGSWKQFLATQAARGDRRAIRRLADRPRDAAIVSDGRHVRALLSRSSRTSRGSIVHNLPKGIRLRESASTIELLGSTSDEALQLLVEMGRQRFGTSRVRLLARKDVQRRLADIALERGLEIAQERER
ncbi:MAG: relaxase/mobilization nuclease domain-containing protein [Myxococcales bacterium]|nr:relaxase/mobilization nuclease domain-containing protein [Myxococcales bacterium]MDH3844033.1 relaxase/mobilization nuclease domain-containing protein [Myxococcales bacterium]